MFFFMLILAVVSMKYVYVEVQEEKKTESGSTNKLERLPPPRLSVLALSNFCDARSHSKVLH
jgi:hypothetical protein